jgi:uncharacterized OB-fold protein
VTANQIPIVGYLALGDDPHLVALRCIGCGAEFFDRREVCAGCEGTDLTPTRVAGQGVVKAFTIVTAAVVEPYIAAIVDCGGTDVPATLRGVPADPDRVGCGMPVRLVTYSLGTDGAGVEAVGYAFEPAGGAR